MKKILLGLLFFALLQTSFAQLRVDANSQLHIGGTSPTERLDVNGAIRIGTTANSNAGTIRYLSNVFEGYNGTSWIDLSSQGYWTKSNTYVYYSAGNVGIGTSSPSSTFDVEGSIEINTNSSHLLLKEPDVASPTDFYLMESNNSNYNIFFRDNTLLTWANPFTIKKGAANNSFVISATSEIGIGTSAPSDKLHVSGDARITGALKDSGNSAGASGDFLQSTGSGTDWVTKGLWEKSGTDFYYDGGNVGVGLINPSAKFQILQAGNSGLGTIRLSGSLTNNTTKYQSITTEHYNNTTETEGVLLFTSTNGSNYNHVLYGGGLGEFNAATELRFFTASNNTTNGGTERMTINSSGNVGIAMTNPSVELDVTGDIEYTGTLTDVSDRRLKKEIKPLKNSLDKILKIEGVSFKMKNDEKERKQLGVIAQNVQKYFPETVSTIDEKGHLGVDYTQLVAPLIEAVKSQQTQIQQLQKEVNRLQKEVNRLKKK